MNEGVVAAVEPASLAESLGMLPGDVLLEINGHALRDVLDVQFHAADEELDLLVRRSGQTILHHTKRAYGVALGLTFTTPTFDGMKRCRNRCEFCFVAQMPAGLRRSLYIRDDDYRYSVLYGSFVTLTNLGPHDWTRLAEQRLSPLYISVHATEPGLRRQLLGRDDIPDILPQIDRLAGLGIEMHTQIVLLPGVNDGPRLDQTIGDLASRYPAVQSIGVVPVGLTRKRREGYRVYTGDEALEVIGQVRPLQTAYRAQLDVSLVYPADEWYLLAGKDPPQDEMYDGYPQIENGIGLVRQFLDDSQRTRPDGSARVPSCTLACGILIAPVLEQAARELATASGTRIQVVPVMNELFGEAVTVSGLLGGRDVIAALQGLDLGEIVFLPAAMFAENHSGQTPSGLDGRLTLDGLTLQEIAEAVDRPLVAVDRMSEVWNALVTPSRSTAG